MAPKRPQVVFLRASTVRSGNALPSLHQNSQPMSQGTYSASSFSRSKTMRAASMTSWPTPSPGIHAIRYFAIGCRSYRRAFRPQVNAKGGTRSPSAFVREIAQRSNWAAARLVFLTSPAERPIHLFLEPARHEILGAAGDDQFLGGGTERRKGERFSVNGQDRFAVINRDLGRHGGGRVP